MCNVIMGAGRFRCSALDGTSELGTELSVESLVCDHFIDRCGDRRSSPLALRGWQSLAPRPGDCPPEFGGGTTGPHCPHSLGVLSLEWVCHSKTQSGCWVPRPTSASPRPQGVGGHWVTLGPPSCPTQALRSMQQDTQIAF